MKFKCFVTLVVILISDSMYSQIVNIEGQRMQTDSTRFVLKNDLYFSFDSIDEDEIFNISNGLSTQLKSKDLKKIYFLIGNFNLVRVSNSDLRNSWLLHLRFNYKITRLFRFETFIQSQYNEFSNINKRNLIGVGVRFKVVSKEHVNLYLGNSYMYEEEKIDAIHKEFYNHRNSTYLSFNATIPKSSVTFLNTIYYQPLYEDFGNYRILEQFKIEIPLGKKLNLNTLFNYSYLSKTDAYSKQSSSNVSIGLGLNI